MSSGMWPRQWQIDSRMAAVLLMRDEPNSHLPNRCILITGASGALGSAIAVQNAASGTTMCLWGRDADRLEETCKAATQRGAMASATQFDITDTLGAVDRVLEQDNETPFDVAYLIAGIGDTRSAQALVDPPEMILNAALVNFAAPAAMASALAERMVGRGGGQIVLIGSAAGHHSLPFAASYSGSKAGLAQFASALRIAMQPHGVHVTLAAPGFIDTPTLRRDGANRPFEIPVEEAARRVITAGQQHRAHYVTPWQFSALRMLDGLIPRALRDRLLRLLEP